MCDISPDFITDKDWENWVEHAGSLVHVLADELMGCRECTRHVAERHIVAVCGLWCNLGQCSFEGELSVKGAIK